MTRNLLPALLTTAFLLGMVGLAAPADAHVGTRTGPCSHSKAVHVHADLRRKGEPGGIWRYTRGRTSRYGHTHYGVSTSVAAAGVDMPWSASCPRHRR